MVHVIASGGCGLVRMIIKNEFRYASETFDNKKRLLGGEKN
jgi:hypothetical protein